MHTFSCHLIVFISHTPQWKIIIHYNNSFTIFYKPIEYQNTNIIISTSIYSLIYWTVLFKTDLPFWSRLVDPFPLSLIFLINVIHISSLIVSSLVNPLLIATHFSIQILIVFLYFFHVKISELPHSIFSLLSEEVLYIEHNNYMYMYMCVYLYSCVYLLIIHLSIRIYTCCFNEYII